MQAGPSSQNLLSLNLPSKRFEAQENRFMDRFFYVFIVCRIAQALCITTKA